MRPDAEPASNAIAIYQGLPGIFQEISAVPVEGYESNKSGCRVRLERISHEDFALSHPKYKVPLNAALAALTVHLNKPTTVETHFIAVVPSGEIVVFEAQRSEVGQPRKPLTPTLAYIRCRINQARGLPTTLPPFPQKF